MLLGRHEVLEVAQGEAEAFLLVGLLNLGEYFLNDLERQQLLAQVCSKRHVSILYYEVNEALIVQLLDSTSALLDAIISALVDVLDEQ